MHSCNEIILVVEIEISLEQTKLKKKEIECERD